MTVTFGNAEQVKQSFDNLRALLGGRLTEDERVWLQGKIEYAKSQAKAYMLQGARDSLRKIRKHPIHGVMLDMQLRASRNLAEYMGIDMEAELQAMDIARHKVGIRTYIGLTLKHGDAYASKGEQVDLNNYNHWIQMAEKSAGEMGWDISPQVDKVRRYSERNAFSRRLFGLLYSRTGTLL